MQQIDASDVRLSTLLPKDAEQAAGATSQHGPATPP